MNNPSIHGRGAADNPANRFDHIEIEREEWTHAEDPAPETRFYRDASRSIIATNDSPDVGFDASINPYRGCEQGCCYCMCGSTLILMADGTTRPLQNLQVGDRIYGTMKTGRLRKYVKTQVLAHWVTKKPAYMINLEDGTELVASGDHRFLTWRGWKFVSGREQGPERRPHLTTNDKLLGTGQHPIQVRLTEHLRFFQTVDTAIRRKRNFEGQSLKSSARLGVVSIEPIGKRTLFDITTGTGDFVANGTISHNCYARPTHEYFGLSAGLDFETRIFVKEDAPELLQKKLSSPKWEPKVLAMSGVTDPYQSIERRMRITRGCLEILAEFRNPVTIITKSHLVTRDLDLLGELAGHRAAAVNLSITSLNRDLQRVMEPRAVTPERRLDAIRRAAAAGVPAGVMIGPVIPGLTDHEMPEILERAAEAGAVRAGYIMLRLPHGVKELFEDWLERHFPDRKEKVLNRLRNLRGGALYDARYGTRMRGEGPYADQVRRMFEIGCRKAGLNRRPVVLSTAAFRRPETSSQLGLFAQ